MKIGVVILVLLGSTFAFPSPGKDKCPQPKVKPPPLDEICKSDGIECPPFETLESQGCFETRNYESAKWATTQMGGDGTDSKKAFMRLFRYIRGNNEEGKKIDMTAPVSMMFVMGKEKKVVDGYMSFYIPSADQDAPPVPKNKTVKIRDQTDFVLYTRAFGYTRSKKQGFKDWTPTEEVIKNEFKVLVKELKKAGVANVNWQFPVVLGYSSPMEKLQRYEVGFTKGASPDEPPKKLSELCRSEENPDLMECAPYDTFNVPGAKNLEGRIYKQGWSITTKIEGKDYEAAVVRLFKYVGGENKEGKKVEMRLPVASNVQLNDVYDVESAYMSLQLAVAADGATPPDPSDPAVLLLKTPEYRVYVRAFGGVPPPGKEEAVYSEQYGMLYAELSKLGIEDVDFKNLFAFMYTNPEEGGAQRTEVGALSSVIYDV